MFTRNFLKKVKRKAMRHGIWFKALDNIERGILSLASRLVYKVKSSVLGVELVKIVKKIRDALKSRFVRLVEIYGLRKVKSLSACAVLWGHTAAREWAYDLDFARYLTLLNLYAPGGWSCLDG